MNKLMSPERSMLTKKRLGRWILSRVSGSSQNQTLEANQLDFLKNKDRISHCNLWQVHFGIKLSFVLCLHRASKTISVFL